MTAVTGVPVRLLTTRPVRRSSVHFVSRYARSVSGSIVYVRASTSTKSNRAPACEMASVVAKKVSGTVTTVSPGLTPAATRASRSASVPLAIPTQNRLPENSAKSRSNSCTMGPPMKLAVSSAVSNTERSSSRSSRCTVTRSRKEILSAIIRSPLSDRVDQSATASYPTIGSRTAYIPAARSGHAWPEASRSPSGSTRTSRIEAAGPRAGPRAS